jgi:hypothetical protein
MTSNCSPPPELIGVEAVITTDFDIAELRKARLSSIEGDNYKRPFDYLVSRLQVQCV